MKRFRDGLVLKTHRLGYLSTLGWRIIKRRCRVHTLTAARQGRGAGWRAPTSRAAECSRSASRPAPALPSPTHRSSGDTTPCRMTGVTLHCIPGGPGVWLGAWGLGSGLGLESGCPAVTDSQAQAHKHDTLNPAPETPGPRRITTLTQERISLELMTSERKPKASRKGSKSRSYGI